MTIPTIPWPTTKQAAAMLNRDIRTVQQLAADGVLKWKTVEGIRGRVYDPEDISRYLNGNAPKANQSIGTAVVVRAPKPGQGERALDTISMIQNLVATMNKDRDMFLKALEIQSQQSAKTLESVLGAVLDRVFDAQRADREDAKARSAHA